MNSGNAAKEQRTTTPPRYATHSMYSAVSEPHKASDRSGSYNTSASAEKIKSTSGKKGLNTKVLTVLGAIALGIGGVMTLGGMAEALSWLGSSYFIEELWTNVIAPLIGFGGTGGILLWAAATIRGYENRKKSYQAYLGNNKTVNLKEMSARLGVPYRKVEK